MGLMWRGMRKESWGASDGWAENTAVDSQPVKTIEDLQTALQPVEPGQTVTLTILRAGKQVEVPVTFSESS